jgi:hypothetical protein
MFEPYWFYWISWHQILRMAGKNMILLLVPDPELSPLKKHDRYFFVFQLLKLKIIKQIEGGHLFYLNIDGTVLWIKQIMYRLPLKPIIFYLVHAFNRGAR